MQGIKLKRMNVVEEAGRVEHKDSVSSRCLCFLIEDMNH